MKKRVSPGVRHAIILTTASQLIPQSDCAELHSVDVIAPRSLGKEDEM
jgi:hypothetical protein